MLSASKSHTRTQDVREQLTFSSLVGALSYALDMTEAAQPGHALRSCLLGMRLGEELGLAPQQLSDLYFALLLKDAGCSSNATRFHQIVGGDERRAKAFSKTSDWTRVNLRQVKYLLTQVHQAERLSTRVKAVRSMLQNSSANAEALFRLRCHQGAVVVRELGLGQGTADAIYSLDEHWNGAGYPDHRTGNSIPLLSRIMNLAQTLDVFHHDFGVAAALDCLQRRAGRWFDPEVVRAAVSLVSRGELWSDLRSPNLKRIVAALEPSDRTIHADEATIDRICVAFSGVVDAKSKSTHRHSTEVARIAVELGGVLGVSDEESSVLHRAGLLHDIGKLSVPNSILDKPGQLNALEWACIREHPRFTHEILSRIPTFERITSVAAAHHEKLDGSGYHLGLQGEEICRLSRLLTVADMYEALSSDRPYRESLAPEDVLNILRRDAPHALDAECVAALEAWIFTGKSWRAPTPVGCDLN